KPFGTGGVFIDRTQLPVAGGYTILVDPTGTNTGSATVTLYNVPADRSEERRVGEECGTGRATEPGQNARLSFSGAAGQLVSVQLGGVTISGGSAAVLKPGGTTFVSKPFGTGGVFIDRTQLPVAGGYTILVDPTGTNTGSATVTLYNVPAD